MNRQKKIFVAFAIIFALFLAYASYDIGRRTTFPGSKPQLEERIKKNFFKPDSVGEPVDSAKKNNPRKG